MLLLSIRVIDMRENSIPHPIQMYLSGWNDRTFEDCLSRKIHEEIYRQISGWKSGFRPQWQQRRPEQGGPGIIDRRWSAVSVEELAYITERLALTEPLAPDTLGANLCVEGSPEFSLLPKGTKLLFPSGAVLLVEEYNPPCGEMGTQIVAKHTTCSGEPLTATAWLRPAAGRRGLVGIVDVPGTITAGDEVEVQVFEEPAIRLL